MRFNGIVSLLKLKIFNIQIQDKVRNSFNNLAPKLSLSTSMNENAYIHHCHDDVASCPMYGHI